MLYETLALGDVKRCEMNKRVSWSRTVRNIDCESLVVRKVLKDEAHVFTGLLNE